MNSPSFESLIKLFGALFIGAVVLYIVLQVVVRSIRKDREDDEGCDPDALLSDLRTAYVKGTMNEEEFRRIEAVLKRGSGGAPSPTAARRPAAPDREPDRAPEVAPAPQAADPPAPPAAAEAPPEETAAGA